MLTVFHLYEKNLKKCDTCDTLGVALHEYAFFQVGRSFSSSPVFVQGALAQKKRDAVVSISFFFSLLWYRPDPLL